MEMTMVKRTPETHLDGVDTVYITIAVVWTFILLLGFYILHRNRHQYFIRMRNVRLGVIATSTIHVYVVIIWLVHALRPRFPCGAEFWIMSIYLPFGIALFQAQNMQLLSVSCAQKELIHQPRLRATLTLPRNVSQAKRQWIEMPWIRRTYVMIGAGMVVQFFLTFIIYLGSRRFHHYGAFSHFVDAAECRKGWEWFPSIGWQFLWAYGFGPFVLFQIRNIRDTHYWRLQTAICIISSLPGSPLWISGLYSIAFADIGKTWPAPLWFAPGMMAMQFVTIYFPIIELWQQRKYQAQPAGAIVEEWEQRRQKARLLDKHSSLAPSSKASTAVSSMRKQRPDMYTMQALENTLAGDSSALLHYAATKQFTGENIVFLTQVGDWKRSWTRHYPTPSPEAKSSLFLAAAEMFTQSVSLQTSAFPVNIESRIYNDLEAIFGQSKSASSSAAATPFADDAFLLPTWTQPANNDVQMKDGSKVSVSSVVETGAANVPVGFNEKVFDQAEKSVRYMVFTNTWPRFVDARETLSITTAESNFSSVSQSSSGWKFWSKA